MTDPYANIRRALTNFDACGSHYWRDELARECDPDTIRELLAERDALERDAERYRWLREQTPCTIRLDGNLRALGLPDGVAPAYLQADTADALDTQIDAAIAAANGGGDG